MKQQYQTRYELLHENYQKWLTGLPTAPVSEACSAMQMRTPGPGLSAADETTGTHAHQR